MFLVLIIFACSYLKEEMMRGKPGYEHLNEPLHILVEAELPVEIIDARLMQAREILEDLLKPVVSSLISISPLVLLSHCFLYWLEDNSLPFIFFRMNPMISTRNNNCESLQCSMVHFVRKALQCLVPCPPSITALV